MYKYTRVHEQISCPLSTLTPLLPFWIAHQNSVPFLDSPEILQHQMTILKLIFIKFLLL